MTISILFQLNTFLLLFLFLISEVVTLLFFNQLNYSFAIIRYAVSNFSLSLSSNNCISLHINGSSLRIALKLCFGISSGGLGWEGN